MTTRRMLLLWAGLALLGAASGTGPLGKRFVTAFLENHFPYLSTPQTALQLLITGYSPSTTVTITGESLGFRKVITLGSGQTVPVQLPALAEMVGGGLFNNAIVVEANKDISVLALNYKHQTADSTVVYPLESLGNEYYIVTPREKLARIINSPEFAVVAGPASTTVQIHLKGLVFFGDRYYNQSSPLSVTLQPYQAIQLQSRDGFSGTRVSAQHPVAVLSGHSCISLMYGQSHVVEQLLPVSSWGSTFVVPPLGEGYFNFDRVYIISSQATHVRHQRGEESRVGDMEARDVMEVEMGGTKALFISASAPIQVLYYSPGGENYGTNYAPFIMNIPPITSYCLSYHLDGLQEFDNYVVVIAKNLAVPTLTLDKHTLGRSQWHSVDTTPYLWSIRHLGTGSSSHVLDHPSSTFGVLSFGVAQLNSYGSAAVCAKAEADSPTNPTPSCDTVQCREKETCQMVNGSPVCVAQSSATCWLSGDPHYKTFDGRYYDFMGTCTYTIAKTCGPSGTLPSFTVEAKNENRGNTRVSYAGFVTVRVYNVTISVVRREIGFVRVNAQRSHLPISLLEGKLRVYQRGVSVIIEADFSLRVSYDWNSYLVVQISSSFWEHVCGLCGNYNGDSRDDFATPAGVLVASPVEFGKSWKVEDGDRFCWDDCHGECKSCSPELVSKYKAEPFCGWITKEAGGPFSQCHSVIDPKIYLDNCVYDLCMNDGLKDMLCQVLMSYADACQAEGVDISDWRTPAGCPLPCPENSQYQFCGSVCPATCNDQAAPNNCSLPCVETCQCNEGFVLDAGKCIHEAGCGCEFQGHLYGPGEQFWGDSTCTRRCVCDPQSRQVSCQATGCRTGEQCRVENGIQNCYPSQYGTCSASGDPHYTSFDGHRFDFQGSCQYQLAGRCQEREELVDFQVLVKNDQRSHRAVSFIRSVEVRVYGVNVTVSRDYPGRFLLNGSLINLPYSTDDGKISMYQRGQDAAIQTDFYLTIAFDWQGRVTLIAPSTYAGALCGLCGNFNGDKEDDLIMKDGRVAPNATAFGHSWQVAETSNCTEANKDMPAKRLLLWLILALLLGPCLADPLGKEFVTVFMQNFVSSYGLPSLELHVASYSPNTTVDITVTSSSFHSRLLLLQPGEPVSVQLPPYTEMLRSSRTNHTVLVVADKEVSVVAFNDKLYTTAASLLYPVREWGREYYIFTPSGEPNIAFKEMAIVNHGQPNLVDIYLKGSVIFENVRYRARTRLRLSMGELSAVQLQSKDDLSGSCVIAQRPVAILSGNTCARRNSQCNHVFQQLLPVPSWGSSFLVPPLPFQPHHDLVYITAAQQAEVTVHRGANIQVLNLTRGQVVEHWVGEAQALYITSTAGVQVVFLSTGGRLPGKFSFDPFLLNVPAAGSYCTSYLAISHPYFTSYVLLVVLTAAVSGLSFNGKQIPLLDWHGIANTSFAWAGMVLPPDSGYNILAHPHTPFGLISVGISHMNGYSSTAVCLDKVLGPCSSMQCRPEERCKVTSGEAFCYAASSRTCWVSGHSHYRTFDGQSYEFPGGCTVILVRTDGLGQRLPAFTVTAQKGLTGLSSLVMLELPDNELVVGLMGLDAGHVWVNHQRRPLPVSVEGGKVQVSQHSESSLLKTSFGLRVLFSQPHQITIGIPSSYYGLVEGMCGNSNGNASNDLVTPGGAQAPDTIAFGNTWRVPGGKEQPCWSKCTGRCRSCLSTDLPALHGGQEPCSMVGATAGPFGPCHLVVPPQEFYESCLYDLCMSDGAQKFMCPALVAYAAVCQAEGVTLDGWREALHCMLQCPAHSRLQTCASACPAACSDLSAPDKCPAPCQETCVCLNGFVQRAAACVPRGECGCALEGRYLEAGKIWGEFCQSVCTCHEDTGEVECHNASCGAQESCQLVDGAWGCHPLPYQSCLAYGDSHYITFDGRSFEYQGDCSYQLAGSCSDDIFSGMVPFYVKIHTHPGMSLIGTAPKSVEIGVYDKIISLSQEQRATVLVDGILIHLPYILKNQLVVVRSSWDVLVKTDSGLTVAFDWDSRLQLSLPTAHVAGVCGLCSNTSGSGGVGGLQGAATECGPAPCNGNCTACDGAQRSRARDRCGMMMAENGPFTRCHSTIDPRGYFQDCISDLCSHQGNETVLCRALAAYTAACQEARVPVGLWRNESFCSPNCPPDSRYDPCAPACPATCCNLSLPHPCPLPCREGCPCTPGHVLSGDQCVPPAGCGCLHQGLYWPLGSSFYTTACEERCTCQAPGRVACQPHACRAHEECSIQAGVRSCYPAPFGTCSAFGRGNYISFDQTAFILWGNCSHVLAEMQARGHLTSFAVWLLRGANQETWPEVRVYGHRLALSWGTTAIQVDGVWGYLPLDLSGSVHVFQHGRILRLETDFGLQVAYDGASLVTISIPGPYQGHVAGLCGNYNGVSSDDLALLDGSISPNTSAFASAWIVDAGQNCYTEDGGQQPPCTSHESQLCHLLLARDGPFSSCHSAVEPTAYFDGCLYDICLGNSTAMRCGVMASYATMCQAAGITIGHWRDLASCPLSCPAHSHYRLCMPTCDRECVTITGLARCLDRCFEGCQCEPGSSSDREACVSLDACGCTTSEGQYLQLGESLLSASCNLKCICLPSGSLTCTPHQCPSRRPCGLRNGTRGCYAEQRPCLMAPGQLLSTFDGLSGAAPASGAHDVSRVCEQNTTGWFRIVLESWQCQPDARHVATVYMFLSAVFIAIDTEGTAWVNGQEVSLPTSVDSELSLTKSQQGVVVQWLEKVEVHLNATGVLEVTVNGSYSAQLCGACGNFNGDSMDDLMARGGTPASNTQEVLASWVAEDFSSSCHGEILNGGSSPDQRLGAAD